jgi:ATP-binding cassette subfamily F protein 3
MERVELSSGRPHVQFTFPSAPQSGRMVFEVENGGMSYDGVRKIFSSCELRIERGDRVAFVGKNGEGKTTMGAILAGKLQLTEGDLKIGHNVTIGYFEQHQAESLDPDKTVYETVETLARAMFFRNESSENFNESRLRSLLGTFLFRGDDVFKKVKVLSGGEKSRLALAKMLLEPVNTLILDEPTNHLDMTSKEVLKQALLSFDGTIIVVSHDRDFLEDLTDRIITFGDGKVKEFMAPLEEYLASLETSVDKSNVTKESKSQEKTDDKQRKKGQAEQQQRKTRSIKPLQNAISTIEKSIAELESRRDMIITAMSSPDYYADSERVKNDNLELNSISTRLTDLYFDWSAKTEELESIS